MGCVGCNPKSRSEPRAFAAHGGDFVAHGGDFVAHGGDFVAHDGNPSSANLVQSLYGSARLKPPAQIPKIFVGAASQELEIRHQQAVPPAGRPAIRVIRCPAIRVIRHPAGPVGRPRASRSPPIRRASSRRSKRRLFVPLEAAPLRAARSGASSRRSKRRLFAPLEAGPLRALS